MANQRAPGKKLIGAQASAELRQAVDAWLVEHPSRTVSDFVLEACLEKLRREGIPVAEDALRDYRGRRPDATAVRLARTGTSSKPASVAARLLKKAAAPDGRPAAK